MEHPECPAASALDNLFIAKGREAASRLYLTKYSYIAILDDLGRPSFNSRPQDTEGGDLTNGPFVVAEWFMLRLHDHPKMYAGVPKKGQKSRSADSVHPAGRLFSVPQVSLAE